MNIVALKPGITLVFFVVFLLMVPRTTFGQERALSLDQALELARTNNTGVQVQALAWQSASIRRDRAWNVFLPTITLTTGVTRANTPPRVLVNPPGVMVEVSPWSALVQLDAQLVINPALINGLQSYDLDLERAEINQNQTLQEVELGVKKQFYQLLLLQEQLRILKAQVRSLEERLSDMRLMFQSGLVNELDVLQIEVGLERLKPQVSQLERAIMNLQGGFHLMLGLPMDAQVTLVGSISLESPEVQAYHQFIQTPGQSGLQNPLRALSLSLSQRPDLQRLENSLASLENGIQGARRQNWPSLILGWNWQPVISDPFSDGRLFTSDNWTDRGSLSLMVRLPLDVWLPGSRYRVNLKQQEIQRDQLLLQTRQAEKAAELEIATLIRNLESRTEGLQALERAVALSLKSLEMTNQAYNLGTRNYGELRDAENEYLATQLELLAGQFEVLMTWFDLEFALGRSITPNPSN